MQTSIRNAQPIPKPAKKGNVPPATERQKDYARSLGIDFSEDIDRREISDLIAAAQDQRLDNLAKVEEREGKVYEKLRKEIEAEIYRDDKPLSTASPGDMATALENRGFAAIVLTFDPRDIGRQCEGFNCLRGREHERGGHAKDLDAAGERRSESRVQQDGSASGRIIGTVVTGLMEGRS